MNKSIIAIAAAGTLALGGCAYGLGDPTGGLLGSVLGGGQQGRGGPDFREAAVDACGSQASRYGQVRITDVQQSSRDTMRVYGTVTQNFRQHAFGCSFRADGRITDFDIQ